MKCPECDCSLHDVVETRQRGVQMYRRRECYNGHRFSTLESVVDLKGGGHPIARSTGAKWPQSLVDRCRADRAAGMAYKEISRLHGVPLNTLAGWLSRGERASQSKE